MAGKKKGKKKGDIFARMSVEQRRQYLERKAAQEQDKTRRREELLAGFLKMKLEDEQKKSSMNEAKLNVKWREILRQVKTDSLKAELKNLNLWITETVEAQDRIINLLVTTLKEASQQRSKSSQKHLTFTQNMAALHEEHIKLVTHDFRKQEISLILKTAEEIQGSTNNHLNFIKQFQLTEKAAQGVTKDREELEFATFQDAVANVKTKLEEEAAYAIHIQESHLEDAWWQLSLVARESELETQSLLTECKTLQEKVDKNVQTKERVDKEIRDMHNEISMWKNRFIRLESLGHDELHTMDNVELSLSVIRNSLNNQTTTMRSKIMAANRIANDSFEKLLKTSQLGEEILHVASLCRRQETTEDKNLPFLPAPVDIINNDKSNLLENQNESQERAVGIQKAIIEKKSTPVFSDSGVGTSISSDRRSYLESRKEGIKLIKPLEEVKENEVIQLIDSDDKISTRTALSLPTITLQRIDNLIQDENALKEIAQSGGFKQQQQSDYVMRETELLLKTHESLSHFWCKLNNVEVQRLSLMKEAQDLFKENVELKQNLKSFFVSQGITCKSLKVDEAPLIISSVPLLQQILREIPVNKDDDDKSSRDKDEVTSRKPVIPKFKPVIRRFENVKPVLDGNTIVKTFKMHLR